MEQIMLPLATAQIISVVSGFLWSSVKIDIACVLRNGNSSMDMPERHISLGQVNIGNLEKQFINEVLNSNRLSHGKYIHAFETEFAALHGCRHAIMCNSGGSAMHLALAVLKEREQWVAGDEILAPAITFAASANAIIHNGLQPVFVDIDSTYYTMDPRRIKAKITPRTRAIIPAHLFGLPCEMDAIRQLAQDHNLEVIEDACHSMFSRYKGEPVGSIGDMACFATDAGQLLTTGVGGVVTTNDDELAAICRSMTSQGRDSIYLTIDDDDDLSEASRRRRIIERRFSYERLGFSFRLTELEGALALAQLASHERMLAQRRENADWLTENLSPYAESLQLPVTPITHYRPFTVYPIVVKNGLDRSALVDYLEAHGIETRYMLPLLNQPVYKKLFGAIEHRYPTARWINRNGFYVGCHQGLTREDLEYMTHQFKRFFAELAGEPDDAA